MHGLTNRWQKLKPAETRLLAITAVMSAIFLLALKLTSEVLEGDTNALDRAILLRVREATNGTGVAANWLRHFMLDMTALGNNGTLTIVVIGAAGYLLAIGKRHLAILLTGSSALGLVASGALKLAFDRPRPELVPHLVAVDTSSFPSGHAMNSAVIYLTLAVMLARAERRTTPRIYILGVGLLLTIFIGLSRIYVGVHWPTDVLVGWAFGATWAAMTALLARAKSF
ncbi:MAG: phosphatase PAP2 family protein [Sphingomonadales bacterium]|nr:phosphatase PAP2 family protein [Sphingomonadales bacterium]